LSGAVLVTNNTNKPIVELGIEFVAELLLFLYPYGAEQMGLPHNFWLGMGCWVIGTGIALRMFWIFPVWSERLSELEKGLIAFILVAVFVVAFYKPVMIAYTKRTVETKTRPIVTLPSSGDRMPAPDSIPSQPEAKPIPTAKPPKEKGSHIVTHSVQRADKTKAAPTPGGSVAVGGNVTQNSEGDCSPNIVGGANTVTCGPPQLRLQWSAKEVPADGGDFEYIQAVTLTVNTPYSPVSLAVVCDSEIEDIRPIGATMSVASGISGKNVALISWASPAIVPNHPFVLWVLAKKPFSVKEVQWSK
jgi:hypothetical protein